MFNRTNPNRPVATKKKSRSRALFLESLEARHLRAGMAELLSDVNTGSAGSFPLAFTEFQGEVFFAANATELWKTDGTSAGTVLIKDIAGSAGAYAYIGEIVPVGGKLAIGVLDRNGTDFDTSDDQVQLWKSDGTTAGTALVKDFGVGSSVGGISDASFLVELNGKVYGAVTTPATGNELWRSDLTSAGTVIVKDIVPGSVGSYPYDITALDGKLFFSANNLSNGDELWTSDGTSTGTALLHDLTPGTYGSYPTKVTAFGGAYYFGTLNVGANGFPGGGDDSIELWKTDGTSGGATMLDNFGVGSYAGDPQLTPVGGTMFGIVSTVATGQELWATDGTTGGSHLVKDINPGSNSYGAYGSFPFSLTNLNGTLVFSASDGTNGGELWRSDGTSMGTVLVKDINTAVSSYGAYGSNPFGLTNANGTLYFAARDATNGFELWKSDGTSTGTVLVRDINTGVGPYSAYGSYPYYITQANGSLYFSADDGINGNEPWILSLTKPDSLAFYGNATGHWDVGVSDTTQFNPSTWALINPASPWAEFMNGDFNGDGFTDIVRWNTTSGTVRVLVSGGESSFTDQVWGTINPASPWGEWHVGDFNGDGKDDVFLINTTGGGIHVLKSTGSAFVDEAWGSFNPNSPFVGYQVGDFTGDGKDDVLRRNNTGGGIRVFESTGSSFNDVLWGSYNPNSPWVDWLVGDFDGNGKDDLFRWNSVGGGVWVFTSNGTTFTDSLWASTNPNSPWASHQVGDFDGNGSDDIIRRNNASGGLRVFHSTNATSFMDSLWGSVNPTIVWQDYQVADFTQDGKADLARIHPGTGAVRVLESGTTTFAADNLWTVLDPNNLPDLVLAGTYADLPPAMPALLAAGGEQSGNAESLNRDDLASIANAAIYIWQEAGISNAQVELLKSVSVEVANLPGAYLGLAAPGRILIDINAAGYGWFIDSTPLDNSEFSADPRLATLDSQLRIDLLTAVMHEMGHVLGYDHDSDFAAMLETLAVGTRRLTSG